MGKYVDSTGLSTAFGLIKNWVTTNFLTDVSYNSTSKKIQKTKNGTTSDVVTLATVATSGSYDDLSNKPTIPSGVSPYDSNPAMDGTASPGSSTLFSRGDHVHPTDTSRAANTDFTGSVNGAAGTHGLVPAPLAKQNYSPWTSKPYMLFDDGAWHGTWLEWTFENNDYHLKWMYSDGTSNIPMSDLVIGVASANGRGLMSSSDWSKLNGIAEGAEINVQSDWNQTNTSADDYIKNKPTIPGDFPGATASADGDHGLVPKPVTGEQNKVLFGDGDWDTLTLNQGYDSSSRTIQLIKGVSPNTTSIGSVTIPEAGAAAGLMSTTMYNKLDGIEAGAEVNVQSNWDQTTTTADDYIKNKPILGTAAAKTVGAASGNLQENGSALSASKAVVTDANKKFVSSSYSLGSACAKTVGASSGNLQENGAALSASKAVVTDANKKFVSSSYTLGAACEKSIGSVADGNTGLVTGDAVYDAIQDALSDVAGALVYKGTAANASAISGTSYKKGWYWIASATFALTSSINVEPGDMIIAKQDKTSTFANDIDVVQTNIDTLTEAEVTALWNAA